MFKTMISKWNIIIDLLILETYLLLIEEIDVSKQTHTKNRVCYLFFNNNISMMITFSQEMFNSN